MEALGTLAGGVAHDLNNILSGITSYPELLLMTLPPDSPLRKSLKIIENSGHKAVTIVEDLLTLSRRGAAVFGKVDVKAVVEDYLASPECQRMLSFHHGINLRTTLSNDRFTIHGSAVHLSKTVMNLITNAAEAMPSGVIILLGLERVTIDEANPHAAVLEPGEYIKLTISDDGSGIAPQDLDHIFEPFFTTKKMGRSGTGLGMAVVWGTVQDHNGHIDVNSQPGQGTTFELFFPAIARTHSDPPTPPAGFSRGRGQTVLVVDDIEDQRQIASGILEQLGYAVHCVPSGEDALAYLRTQCVDLVLLDMIMDPGMGGLETYRGILQFNPGQRVVIASGFSQSDLIREALDLGARSYLKKPYRIEAIAKAVAEALNSD